MSLANISKYLQTSEDGAMALPAGPWLVCVSDLRFASSSSIKQLVDMLEAVEHQQRGTVAAIYFLKPRNKTRSHALKKMLGIKPSKKNPKVPLFKVFLVKTLQDLHTQVNSSQLTLDFYGTLQYSHHAWMRLYEVVIHCIRSGQRLLSKLPSVQDRVELLQEYDTEAHTSSQLQGLLADLTEKFQMIHSESGLPAKLMETKQTLFSLDHPGSDDQLSSALPGLAEGLSGYLRGLYTRLDRCNTALEDTWRATQSKLTILIQVHRHRERAKEIEHKICQHYQPLLQEHPIVGRTLSQAELYRAHFTTTLHEPAKELLSQATEILEAVQRLKSSESLQSISAALSRRRGSVAPMELNTLDMSDITRCLTTSIQPFTNQLQQLQQVYVNVHIFHLLFEKTLSWYKKALKFLPESLLERCSSDSGLRASEMLAYSTSSHSQEVLLYMPSEWLGVVRVFLSRHPPPRQEHIDRLDERIPHLVDKRLRAQARSLALRLRLLHRVLSSTRLPLRLVQAVVTWKTELFRSLPNAATNPDPRPSLVQQGGGRSGSPQRERQRGVQFSQPGEEEFRGVRPGHHSSQPGESPSINTYAKGERPRRLLPGLDKQDVWPPAYYHANQRRLAADPAPPHNDFEVKTARTEGDVRFHERGQSAVPHRRTAGARSMLRARSVDFKLNSSSTDGSVFDYDKAALGVREGYGASRGPFADDADSGKQHDPHHKKQQSVQEKEQSQRDRLKHALRTGAEQALSDPSDLFADSPRGRVHGTLPGNRGVSENQSHSLASGYQHMKYISDSPPDPEPSSFAGQLVGGTSSQHLPQSSDSSSQERFIRINLSPRKTSQTSRDEFTYPSDVEQRLGPASVEGGEWEEEESGFDTAEGTDPYDSIVTRIREISSSNYTNAEKLQRVSELISKSRSRGGDAGPHRDVESRLKSAKSTMDLSRVEKPEERIEFVRSGEGNQLMNKVAQSSPRGRPVEVIQRMKQNLAKSMEDLTSVPSFPEGSAGRHRNPSDRFRSELWIEPVFSPPDRNNREATVVESRQYKHSLSDVETSKSSPMLTSPAEGTSRTRTVSDPDEDNAQASFRPVLSDNWSQLGDNDEEASPSPRASTRPSNLSLLSSRNFISPSFLRPAMSMQDLTSQPVPAANLRFQPLNATGLRSQPLTEANLSLLQELEAENDFQALEDMEMLQAPQDNEPFSHLPGGYRGSVEAADRDKSTELTQRPGVDNDHTEATPVALDEQNGLESRDKTQSAGEDIIANFVMYGDGGSSFVYKDGKDDAAEASSTYIVPSSSNTSPSWVQRAATTSGVPSRERNLSMEEEEKERPLYLFSIQENHLHRLAHEADQEYRSQENVAQSLRSTQKILEDEEKRQERQFREHVISVSPERHRTHLDQGRLAGPAASMSISTDNGYSSWASRLVSALSTSSEGGDVGGTVKTQAGDWKDSSGSEETCPN